MSNLIVYFSRAGSNWVEDGVKNIEIGNTKLLATLLKNKIDCDIFEIRTKKVYPEEYYACTEEAKNEVKNNIFPDVLNAPENLDKYDTIYIGHPIWWDNIPNVMIGFLKKYNWQGKTIYHFCTHEGSGAANSPKTLENICKGAVIKPYFETRGYMCQDMDNFDIEGKIDSWVKQ